MAPSFSKPRDCKESYEIVAWRKNYFMDTINIYEKRGPKYECVECKEFFNSRLSWFTHSQMHMKPFCIVCGIYTIDQEIMHNHMKCCHPNLIDIQKNQQDTLNEISEEVNVVGKVETSYFTVGSQPLKQDRLGERKTVLSVNNKTRSHDPLLIPTNIDNKFPMCYKEIKLAQESAKSIAKKGNHYKLTTTLVKSEHLLLHQKGSHNNRNKKQENGKDIRPTKSVVSRFGRCINVKIPEF